MTKLIIIGLLLPLALLAKPELRSQKALKIDQSPDVIKAELAAGHHFNDKAPNGFQAGPEFVAPTLMEKQKIEISLDKSKSKQGTAHLYVCDDEVTYCEVHSIEIGPKKATVALSNKSVSPKKKNGFILNSFNESLAEAKKSKKLLLVDFSARWCPACMRLESEIFSQESFSRITKKFIKVKLDGDLFSNAPIMEKYKIKGYPTILFLTSEGEEIIRFMDYQNFDVIHGFVKHAEQYPMSIAELEKKSSDESLHEGLWKRYYYSGDFEKALKVMDKLRVKPKEYLTAKVEHALSLEKPDAKETNSNTVKTLKEVLTLESNSVRSNIWRSLLIEKLKDDKKESEKLAQQAEKLTLKWLSDDKALSKALESESIGEFAGFEKFYAALVYADVAEQAGWKKEEAWKLAVKVGNDSNITSQQLGASLRLFNAMMKAKEHTSALQTVEGLLKKNPQSGDLQRRKMRALMELNRHDEAVKIGEVALKNSYGRNEFDVALPLAKSYLALNNKKRAQTLADQYLSKNEVNFPRMAQMKKDLEDVKTKALAQSEGPSESHPDKK